MMFLLFLKFNKLCQIVIFNEPFKRLYQSVYIRYLFTDISCITQVVC